MRIVIAGGSGFIGEKLTSILVKESHEVIILSRREAKVVNGVRYVTWLQPDSKPEIAIGSADAFINLAGVSINEGRWTESHQLAIYESRMEATDELIRIISAMPEKPSVLVNASAIGIYPASEEAIYTETSSERASDFLAKTVIDWENKAATVAQFGTRTVFTRFGVVLGDEGGALPLMVLPYRLFAGGKIGSGQQWLSWVHVEDVARAIAFAVLNENIHGPVNVTAPFPQRMNNFGKVIGSTLRRPHWFPVPAFMMKMALGKKSTLVLEGQHVLPEVLLKNGFKFRYPTAESALKNILK